MFRLWLEGGGDAPTSLYLGQVEGTFEDAYNRALAIWNVLPHNADDMIGWLDGIRIEAENPPGSAYPDFWINYTTHER